MAAVPRKEARMLFIQNVIISFSGKTKIAHIFCHLEEEVNLVFGEFLYFKERLAFTNIDLYN